jgi:cephalosporin hydroxylase
MKHMGFRRSMFSIDIDKRISDYAQQWVAKAGLQDFVKLDVSDSTTAALPSRARSYFGGPIAMIFIDSSHQYRQTLSELDLWYPSLKPGGLIILHDTADFSVQFDTTGKGGIKSALVEWLTRNRAAAISLNAGAAANIEAFAMTYGDPCGLGIIQKPFL